MTVADDSWWTRVLAGPGGDLRAAEGSERYLVLPTSKSPRVVVDRSNHLALRDAVERFVESRTTSAAVRRMVGRTSSVVATIGATWAVAPSVGGQTLRQHLSDVIGEPVQLSVAVGPPRPNQKPVVRCYGERGLLAVAKLGPDPHTQAMVQNEAHWLDVLGKDPLDGVETPHLLHAGDYGHSALLVMGALDLESDLGLTFDEVPSAVIRELSDRFGSGQSLAESSWWLELTARLDGSTSLLGSVDEARGHPLLADVMVSAWHGDWSPWNMGVSSSGGLCVWDWERAAVGVPRGFDLVHQHYQYGSGLDAADGDLADLGVPAAQHELVKWLYLLEVCARHVEAGSLGTERHQQVLADLQLLRRRAGAR